MTITRFGLIIFISTLLHHAVIMGQVNTQTFVYTGTVQTFTVPPCVFSLTVDLRGAQGGMANDKVPSNGPGGLGGRAYGVLTVTPGMVINVMVGGQGFTTGVGGFNGGGTGGYGSAGSSCFGGFAGGGGGATDIRINGTTLNDRVAVAGGGGGAGRDYCNGTCQPCGCGGNGGCGGGINGMPGLFALCAENPTFYPGNMMNGGGPGTQTAGGYAGQPDNSTTQTLNAAGTSGSLGIGGNGGGGTYDVAGGGGGGGWYGGGGGGTANSGSGVGGGGGGGGSSYIANLSNATTSTCVQSGNGVAIFSYSTGGNNITVAGSPTAICSGGSTTLTASGQISYTWSTGSSNSSIVVSPGTSTTYIASGTNSLNCVSTKTIFVQVDNNPPSLTAFAAPAVICPGETVTLMAVGANTYTWSNGVNNGSTFTPSASAIFTVTGANGCGSTTHTTAVTVNPKPLVTASALNPTVCLGNSSALNASGANTYTWSNSLPNNTLFYPSTTAAYTVVGTGANNCTASAVAEITVVPFTGPSVAVVPSGTAICQGSTITLNANSMNSYTWSSGSNSGSIAVNPSSSASYTVSGTNSSGCISSAIVSVTVDANLPALSVVSSTNSICEGKTVTIGASGATTYTFSGGISNNVAFTPSVSNTYTVTGANACGSMSVATTVSVNPAPSVTAVAVTPTLCSGNAATVLATGANSYSWSGNIPNGGSFYPSATSNYTVTGYSAFGCTNTAVTAVTVYLTPSVSPLPSPPLICTGNTATITAFGALNYSWQPGNINTSAIVVSPTVTTVYTVTQSNANCSDVKTATVIVNSLPTLVAFAGTPTICSSATTNLSAGGAATYTWTAPNYTFAGANAIVSPSVTTVYSLAASDGTCSNTATVQVYTNPNPTLSIAPSSTNICSGKSVTLTANGGLNYTWTPAGPSGTTVVISPSVTSLVSLLGDNSFGCTSGAQVAIIVNNNPTVTAFTNKPLMCSGQTATLSAGGALTYSWSSGTQGPSSQVSPLVNTVYTLTGTLANNCSSTQTVQVSIFSPDFNAPAGASACLGGSVTLTASGANSYTWNNTQPFASIVVSPSVNTNYIVSATSSSNGVSCVSTKTVPVVISPNPSVTAQTSSTLICKNSKVTLTGNGAATYSWSTGVTGKTIQPVVTAMTTYTVIGTDSIGCKSTATVLVRMSTCIGIEEFNISSNAGLRIFPNPNTGEFNIESRIDLDLTIINELGQIIRYAHLNDQNARKVRISELAKGVYFIVSKSSGALIREKIVVSDH